MATGKVVRTYISQNLRKSTIKCHNPYE